MVCATSLLNSKESLLLTFWMNWERAFLTTNVTFVKKWERATVQWQQLTSIKRRREVNYLSVRKCCHAILPGVFATCFCIFLIYYIFSLLQMFSSVFGLGITVCASCLAASDTLKNCTLLYNPLTLDMSNDSSVVVSIFFFFLNQIFRSLMQNSFTSVF